MKSAPLQRVSVAKSDQRQLEGAGSHSCPEGPRERLRTSIGSEKPWVKRLSVSSGNVASAPHQRVRVAHCDHSTAGRRQTTFLTRQLWRASKEVHWKRQTIGKSAWRLTMQKGVGAYPKGHGRTRRLHDSGKAPDSILDQETSEHLGRYNGVAKACVKS